LEIESVACEVDEEYNVKSDEWECPEGRSVMMKYDDLLNFMKMRCSDCVPLLDEVFEGIYYYLEAACSARGALQKFKSGCDETEFNSFGWPENTDYDWYVGLFECQCFGFPLLVSTRPKTCDDIDTYLASECTGAVLASLGVSKCSCDCGDVGCGCEDGQCPVTKTSSYTMEEFADFGKNIHGLDCA
jgi:hypothetical protein